MFRLPRPLVVGLGIVPPALMIVGHHPWIGAATFTVVFAVLLLRPRERDETPAAAVAEQDRDLVPSGAAYDPPVEDLPRPQRDGLIHYPPRRLPL